MLFVLFVLVGVAVVALLVVLIVVGARRERERQQRIQQWAAHHGWTITERPVVDWTARLPGHDRRGVSVLVSGMCDGRHVSVAEYSYTTESMADSDGRRSTTTHHLIVTAIRLDVPHSPLSVQPRGALSRFGRTMFGDNAAATGHDAFDRQFRVHTRNPALARTLIGPALIAEHCADQVPAWSLAGHDLLTWQTGSIRDPHHIATLAAPLVRVAKLLGR